MKVRIVFQVATEMEIDDDCKFYDLKMDDIAHRALRLSPKKLELDDFYMENLEPMTEEEIDNI